MPLPVKLQAKLLARFDELIVNGESIHKSIELIPGEWKEAWVGRHMHQTADRYCIDWPRFVRWRENAASLLDQVVPKESVHRKSVDTFQKLEANKGQLEYGISKLKALRDDFDKGFLGDLMVQVEAELAADYLGQAELLLNDRANGNFDHIPAAVLAGAVLERALRTLCTSQTPPISIAAHDGRPLAMTRIIDDLKAAAIISELVAKQLRACAEVRNAAAHGHFDKFGRQDVATMLSGITGFLSQHTS